VVSLLKSEQIKQNFRKQLDRLSYLKQLSEVDIHKCYQPCFLKDIFYKFDDFPESSFRMLVNLKFTALSQLLNSPDAETDGRNKMLQATDVKVNMEGIYEQVNRDKLRIKELELI
jgi:hypothetical protein